MTNKTENRFVSFLTIVVLSSVISCTKPSSPPNPSISDTNGATLYINSSYPDYNGFGKLYAIDANSGTLRWKFRLSVAADESAPAFFNGVVYNSMGKSITAIDTITKNIKWQFPTGFNQATPTLSNGVVYINGRDQFLYALDAITGNLKWKYQLGVDPSYQSSGSNPTIANGVVYIGGQDGYIYMQLMQKREL